MCSGFTVCDQINLKKTYTRHSILYTLYHIQLTMNISRYLIMFRPPAREICLNALEDVYQSCMSNIDIFLPFFWFFFV